MALAAARGREHALSILERNAAAAALLAVPEQSAAETLTVHLEEYSGAEVLRKRTVASPRDHEWLGRRTSTTSAARVERFHIRHTIDGALRNPVGFSHMTVRRASSDLVGRALPHLVERGLIERRRGRPFRGSGFRH